ncbi:alpha/beta hydrolase [Amorphus orientalis]|uniref:Membrane protein n=1 Tax=Amorphus orientalis TaxID=649198 RepID=A0AAE3VQ85_9HYPH|nr:alpha/beta-hydrolase family protein [Amorphus orientalis]MDQ0316322.1 putative membrane protein [Amorphus orientalis]
MQTDMATRDHDRTDPTDRRWLNGHVSPSGVLLGFLLFAASLTPSLIPRNALMQGLLGGASFVIGYGIAVGLVAIWVWLGFRPLGGRRTGLALAVAGALVAAACLLRAPYWQDSIRELMGLPPLESVHRIEVLGLAIATAAVLFAVAWLFKLLARLLMRAARPYVPERVAILTALIVAAALFATLIDGVLVRYMLVVLDTSYAQLDELVEPDTEKPAEPWKTGSAESLVSWIDLGREGRRFIDGIPERADIAEFWSGDAVQPVRVYVGLNAADTADERAEIALAEMLRVGAFDRAVLAVAIPTGTGFMDQNAIETLEYLHRGDVATVAAQYSYLQSPFSLIFEPGYGAETAHALLKAVYDHWTGLPENDRPRLYLQGLSLGALSSEQSLRLHEIIGDPLQGALWSGPPFPSPIHSWATADRNPQSPEWLPTFEDGSLIRFMNKPEIPEGESDWGPLRVVYLQHASDPIVFFSTDMLWQVPDWMRHPRGPDVSPKMRWVPVVTALQVAADMALSNNAPIGHGHQYAAASYIDGWIAVTAPDIDPADIDRLKARFAQ